MNKDQRKKWYKDTITLNKGLNILIDTTVTDIKGNIGSVVSITKGVSPEEHGFIEVKLNNGTLEHYVYFEWYKHLRVITKPQSKPYIDL